MLNKFKIIFCEKFYFSGIKKTVKDCKIFNIKTKTFTDGEYFIKIPQKIKKQKILIIHSLHDGEDFIKISLLIREVIKNDNEITLLIPYLGYCRNHNPNDSYTEIFIKSFLTQNVEKIILLEPHAKYVFRKYEDTKKMEWDEFNSEAKNGHFFFYRDYIEYHNDRFHDFSLIIYNDKGNIMALLPASIDGDTVISHGGLTFGGFVCFSQIFRRLLWHRSA